MVVEHEVRACVLNHVKRLSVPYILKILVNIFTHPRILIKFNCTIIFLLSYYINLFKFTNVKTYLYLYKMYTILTRVVVT